MKPDLLLKKLWDIKRRRQDEVPKGYASTTEWSKKWKCRYTTAMLNLKELEKAGVLKKIRLRKWDGKRIVMVYYYG